MRVLWVVLVLLGVAVAGCMDDPAPEPAPTVPGPGEKYGSVLAADDPLAQYTWNGTNLIFDELDPPVLTPGTAWTYARGGVWDLTDELTVIVTQDGAGYVFGASSQEETLNAAVWTQHWYGSIGPDLNHQDLDADLFDWPLHDGKVFPLHDLMMNVVAELVETPVGTLPGYRIEGSDGNIRIAYTFVPQVGYLTAYSYGRADGTEIWESLELREVATAEQAVWLDRGPAFSIGTDEGPVLDGANLTIQNFEVPIEYDEMIFVGLGTSGAEVRAQAWDPVDGGSWGFQDAGGLWDWQVGRVPATPGPWLFEAHKGPEGWAYFQGLPVRWTDLTV